MSRMKRRRNEVPVALQSVDVKAVLRRRGFYLKQRENQRLKLAAKPLAKALVKKKNGKKHKEAPVLQKYNSLSNELAQSHWEKTIHDVETIERYFEIAVKKILHDVEVKALANIESVINAHKSVRGKKKQVFDDNEVSDLQNQAQVNLTPLLENMAIVSGQDAMRLTGSVDPYIASEKLRAKIQSNVEKFTTSMLSTDQEFLTNLITEGIQNGESVQQIRSAVTDNFSQYSTMQANRITRTEVLRASVQSSKDAFEQSGLVDGVQWLTAGADDECADYEGQIESLDGNFYDNTDEFADGDPPLHPNCRCILLPVLIDSGGNTADDSS